MTQWLRCYWDEEDTWFYLEADDDGWISRQVELQGPERKPIAAASLTEWRQAQQAGRLREYEANYGLTADQPITTWEGWHPEFLSQAEFESVWEQARRTIETNE